MSLKESKRMELICEFIKSGKQPDGYKITETKTGKYRLSKVKSEREVLEGKRARALKSIEAIDEQLKKLQDNKPEAGQEQESEPTD